MRLVLLTLLCTSAGCESGVSIVLDIDVADGIARSWDQDAPGVLVAGAQGRVEPVLPMCGDVLEERLTWVYEVAPFGCLQDSWLGSTEVLSAWIEPLPAGWDAVGFCALERTDGYGALWIPPEISGASVADTAEVEIEALARAPEASWPQGETVAEWRRNATPCGGVAIGEVVVR